MFIDHSRTLDAIRNGFYKKPVLVVGDLMLDRYLWGEVSRISPEAPVPIVRVIQETENGGGAANVALNLANLGICTSMVGWIGVDAEGYRLRELLTLSGVKTHGIHATEKRPTITKTRVIGGHQQMLRLDLEDTCPIDHTVLTTCLEEALKQIRQTPQPEAILLSDYGKGILTENVCQPLIRTAREIGIPVFVDPKGVDYHKYRGATVLTPNRHELGKAIPLQTRDLDLLLVAAEKLRLELDIDLLAVTLSEQGIVLLETGKEPQHIPAMAREVYDVSGAGDTVISTLTAGVAAGMAHEDALRLANLAAGIVVAKVGTTPISRSELLSAFSSEAMLEQSNKICTLKVAQARTALWRQRGEQTVFTNGCFDLLHAGHVTYLEKARQLGKRLVIGLNSDHSVRLLKGSSRPVIHEADRARILAAMASVDLVVLFDEETPQRLIRALQPDILVKGADYKEDQVAGAKDVRAWGGRVVLVPLLEGRSSSKIMEQIKLDARA